MNVHAPLSASVDDLKNRVGQEVGVSSWKVIDQDRIDRSRGMDITVVTTATNDDEGRALLKRLGFPFKEN